MSRPVMLMFSILFVSTAQPANAQGPAFGGALQPRIAEGVALAPRGGLFVGGYSSPGGTERNVTHFYTVRDPKDRSPEGVAYASVPVANRALETVDGRGVQHWADGRYCPQLYGVLYEFSRLSPPLFYAPQLTPDPSGSERLGAGPMRIHGSVVSVWGYARQADGAPMTMMLTGTDGIIDRWARWSDDQLEKCWSDQEPNFAPAE